MSAVGDAWARYVVVATEAGATLNERIEPASGRAAVIDAFDDAGMDSTEDLLDYFELLFHVESRSRVYPSASPLDLAGAIAERHQLTDFATREAADYDNTTPDDLFPNRFFPICSGKPTTSVDRTDLRVYDWWWDEDEPRLAAESLADWIDLQSASITADLDRARQFFQPTISPEPRFVGKFGMRPGQVWIKEHGALGALMHIALDEGRDLILSHAGIGSIDGFEGLEMVQAELLAQLMINLGAPPERIVFEEIPLEGNGNIHVQVRGELGYSA